MNGDSFTEHVRQVLQRSREEAVALRHEYVGTEHLLLGVLAEEKGIGSQVLIEAGVTLDAARGGCGGAGGIEIGWPSGDDPCLA